jgi:hypothetical protein
MANAYPENYLAMPPHSGSKTGQSMLFSKVADNRL